MLRESRHETLKILIDPLDIKLSSLETVSAVVPGFNNLYFVKKSMVILYVLKKKI